MTSKVLSAKAKVFACVVACCLSPAAHSDYVYWNLFNIEGESDILPSFVTYDTLDDMLNDENRTGGFLPDGFAGGTFGVNIVGTGAFFVVDSPVGVPEPSSAWLMMLAMAARWWARRRTLPSLNRMRIHGRFRPLGARKIAL